MVRRLGECDLVIDATANPLVFDLLSFVASRSQKPMVWMEVFGGGIGGYVARSRPAKDASALAIRDAYYAYTQEHPPAEFRSADDYLAVNPSGDVLVASDADVGIIAAHATQLALDALVAREPSRFPYSLYLVGFARAWVFEAPFHTIPVATPGPEPETATLPATRDQVEDGLNFIGELIKEAKGASPPSS